MPMLPTRPVLSERTACLEIRTGARSPIIWDPRYVRVRMNAPLGRWCSGHSLRCRVLLAASTRRVSS